MNPQLPILKVYAIRFDQKMDLLNASVTRVTYYGPREKSPSDPNSIIYIYSTPNNLQHYDSISYFVIVARDHNHRMKTSGSTFFGVTRIITYNTNNSAVLIQNV